MTGAEARIARLEAESQIRQLVARYCFEIDDRRIDNLRELFTEDATLRSADGVMFASGVDAIIDQFHRRFDVLGPGQHFMHDLLLDFEGAGSHRARGRVSGHAELWRNNQMMVAAIRYNDVYQNTGNGWKFAEREISFLYYVPVHEYPGVLRSVNRNMAYEAPLPADFPEMLKSWQDYEKSRSRS